MMRHVGANQSVASKVARSFKAGWAVGGSETLTEVLMDRGVSLPKAMTVCRWIALWGVYREATGLEPESVDAVCALTKVNRRTAFRWQAGFREAFPEMQSPAVLWELVKADLRGDDVEKVAVQVAAAHIQPG
jgi:hypothetical protein